MATELRTPREGAPTIQQEDKDSKQKQPPRREPAPKTPDQQPAATLEDDDLDRVTGGLASTGGSGDPTVCISRF